FRRDNSKEIDYNHW
ncbi:unnamed protein product, partial [Allacma fusca]